MNRCINVFANEALVKENRVLVVVTFPSHEADECILTDCNFTVACCGTVCNNLTLSNAFAGVNDRDLVCTVALVASLELGEVLSGLLSVVTDNCDVVCINAFNVSVSVSKSTNTGVNRCLVLHTCTNDRRVSDEKRNSLLLHV